jgi:hypothetical protein
MGPVFRKLNMLISLGFQKSATNDTTICHYYMVSITSGEMANCDWLKSTFSGPLFSRNGPAVQYIRKNRRMHFKTKQQN